jgi:hypothetical protein
LRTTILHEQQQQQVQDQKPRDLIGNNWKCEYTAAATLLLVLKGPEHEEALLLLLLPTTFEFSTKSIVRLQKLDPRSNKTAAHHMRDIDEQYTAASSVRYNSVSPLFGKIS